jgi:hypothetical protein
LAAKKIPDPKEKKHEAASDENSDVYDTNTRTSHGRTLRSSATASSKAKTKSVLPFFIFHPIFGITVDDEGKRNVQISNVIWMILTEGVIAVFIVVIMAYLWMHVRYSDDVIISCVVMVVLAAFLVFYKDIRTAVGIEWMATFAFCGLFMCGCFLVWDGLETIYKLEWSPTCDTLFCYMKAISEKKKVTSTAFGGIVMSILTFIGAVQMQRM